MKSIAIFYHGLFELGEPPKIRELAVEIIRHQMAVLKSSGLLDVASEFIAGVNGAETSMEIARLLIPPKAQIVMHGLQCRNECRTILLLEKWIPSHEDWYVLYFHAKGCTQEILDTRRTNWLACMMKRVVQNWRDCVMALDRGYEVAGCHYMKPPRTPFNQHILAGNFWWAKASFLKTLPSIMARERIKLSGIDSADSRYESEVWIGNGRRPPKVFDFHPNWNLSSGPHP